MFKVIIITAIVLLAIAWIAYGTWRAITYYKEKGRPRPRSERLQKARKSFDEYAKKMESYKKKTYEREQE